MVLWQGLKQFTKHLILICIWTKQLIKDLPLLLTFLTGKHYIYEERLLVQKKKVTNRNKGSVVIVLNDSAQVKDFLSQYTL